MIKPLPSMSLALVSVLAFTTGCEHYLRHHNDARDAAVRSQTIEAACTRKDLEALDTNKHYEPDAANRERMVACTLAIKTEQLVALDCGAFAAAFEWITETEGTVKHSHRNPRSSFATELADRSAAQVDAVRMPILNKAVACHVGSVLFSDLRVSLGDEGWDRAFATGEHDGLALYPLLVSYVRGTHAHLKSQSIVTWLETSKSAGQCAELESATRNDENLRADMLHFFVQKGCKSAAHTVAAELLASPAAGYRARGCMALRDLGDRSETSRMRLLASRDTARSLEAGYTGFWLVTYVTFPVREACQTALNELELTQGVHARG